VDLWGRLSNPPETLEALTVQGVATSREAHAEHVKQAICSPTGPESDVQEVPGRLSNPSPRPVQRRLSAADISDICASYIAGSSIDALARARGVNRTTIITHLDQRDVPRRRVVRKMTDPPVAEAAARYRQGHSLAAVADQFNIDARTLAREFRKAGIAIRPRPGWAY